MGRRGTARNRFPKSFRSPRPPANRRLSLPRNARLRSPSEGPAAAQDLLRSTATGDRDVSPTEYSGPRHLPARRAIRVAIVRAIRSASAFCLRICRNRRPIYGQASAGRATKAEQRERDRVVRRPSQGYCRYQCKYRHRFRRSIATVPSACPIGQARCRSCLVRGQLRKARRRRANKETKPGSPENPGCRAQSPAVFRFAVQKRGLGHEFPLRFPSQ